MFRSPLQPQAPDCSAGNQSSIADQAVSPAWDSACLAALPAPALPASSQADLDPNILRALDPALSLVLVVRELPERGPVLELVQDLGRLVRALVGNVPEQAAHRRPAKLHARSAHPLAAAAGARSNTPRPKKVQ